MLKPTVQKPILQRNITRKVKEGNIARTISFNTKGYYNPKNPCDQNYFKNKIDVFNKYRKNRQQLVVISNNMLQKKEKLKLIRQTENQQRRQHNFTTLTLRKKSNINVLLKKYLQRKVKVEKQNSDKFQATPLATISRIQTECLTYRRAVTSSASLYRQIPSSYTNYTNYSHREDC